MRLLYRDGGTDYSTLRGVPRLCHGQARFDCAYSSCSKFAGGCCPLVSGFPYPHNQPRPTVRLPETGSLHSISEPTAPHIRGDRLRELGEISGTESDAKRVSLRPGTRCPRTDPDLVPIARFEIAILSSVPVFFGREEGFKETSNLLRGHPMSAIGNRQINFHLRVRNRTQIVPFSGRASRIYASRSKLHAGSHRAGDEPSVRLQMRMS